METDTLLFVGLKGHVIALEKTTGKEVWRSKLPKKLTAGDRFVTLVVEDSKLYAHTYGALHCLDKKTGAVTWTNWLEGLSYDLASLATTTSRADISAIARKRRLSNGGGDSGGGGSDGCGDGGAG